MRWMLRHWLAVLWIVFCVEALVCTAVGVALWQQLEPAEPADPAARSVPPSERGNSTG